MLWDDGYPGGGIDKLLTEGMETTPSACGTGDAACEAINPTNEIRTTTVNLAMFTTLSLFKQPNESEQIAQQTLD